MAKPKASDLQKQLDKQQKYWGDKDEESYVGSAPDPGSDDNIGEVVEEITGEEPEEKPFSIAEEVEKDEEALHTKPEEPEDVV